MNEIDIYRTTNTLFREHGDKATIHAAMRADELLDQGDLDGVAVWKRIVKAVEALLDTEPPTSLTDITQVNFNILAMVCGRWLHTEVSNHRFNLPSIPVEFWPSNATSFRRFARAAGERSEYAPANVPARPDPFCRWRRRAWEGAGIGLMSEARRYEIGIAAQILTCQLLHEEGLLDNSQLRCDIGASVFFGNIHRLQ